MKLHVTGQVVNIFKRRDFKDKETGEVKEGKHVVQFMVERDLGDGLGTQLVLEDISIPPSLYDKLKAKKGHTVTFPVGAIASGNRVILYGVDE